MTMTTMRELVVKLLCALAVMFCMNSLRVIKVPPHCETMASETVKELKPIIPLGQPQVVSGKGSYNLTNPKGLRLSKEGEPDWSQVGQSVTIDAMLNRKRDGFFIELGGYDGELWSNSLFFEKNRDWNGLLIEANPFAYKQMLKKDRRCHMVNACVSDDVPKMEFVIAGGITSATSIMSSSHKARIARDSVTYGKTATWEGVGNTVETNCSSLSYLMEQVGRTHVDYFILDVEGAELFVLHSIDFDHLHFDVVMIEVQEHGSEIKEFMESKGFALVKALAFDHVFRYEGSSNRTAPVKASGME